MQARTEAQAKREAGAFLLEMMFALVIFTVGLLGFLSSYRSMFRASEDSRYLDRVEIALRNVAAELRHGDFDTLYATRNGTAIPVVGLGDPGGGPAQIQIACFVNETTLPADFGPVLDIDGDGTLSASDCSSSYRVLPVRLRLTYATVYGAETRDLFVVIQQS
jgi:hypothetical protein